MKEKIKSIILLIAMTAIITSCMVYKPPKEYKFIKSETYQKSYNELWSTIIKYLGENNINILNMEKESGFIKATYKDARISGLKGDIMDCGENADVESYLGEFNIVVKEEYKNKVTVTVNTFFSCNRITNIYASPRWVEKTNCNSTGVFEKHLFSYLRSN